MRYHKHGFIASSGRRDKDAFRKVEPEAVQEAAASMSAAGKRMFGRLSTSIQ